MRVYEFAKQNNLTTKEVLDALSKGNFNIGSHMSVLAEKEMNYLNKIFKTNKGIVEKVDDVVVHKTVQETKKPITTPKVMQTAKTARVVIEPKKIEKAPFVVMPMTVDAFATAAEKSVVDVIMTLLKWGVVAAKNKVIEKDVVARLVTHYDIPVSTATSTQEVIDKGVIQSSEGESETRLPVVVVMGHVDHGKTTLLDFIRKTRVASREKGGITQHLGAYQAKTLQGDIVFIDTPGHEAFSRMRMRGVKVADIAILVVAADDGVMPQTIEAIKQAKKMEVPIIVAINKIDRVDQARVDVIKRSLAQYDLISEDWGGDVIMVPISAKNGIGIEQLLGMIILQSQLMELKADVTGSAKGYVLEACLEKGRGSVATILLQHGNLQVGDFFACGNTVGKVSSLVDSYGARIKSVGPSHPVRVAGFAELPEAGDFFQEVAEADYREAKANPTKQVSSFSQSLVTGDEVINLVIKVDTNSSKEALLESIAKIGKKIKSQFNIIRALVGDIGEGDISLAASTRSILFGLHIKAEPNALSLAQQEGVEIRLFDIIYKLLENLEALAMSKKKIAMKLVKTGEAVVRRVFDIKGQGVIAGCYVTDGTFSRKGSVVVWRGKQKIGGGVIKTLQRDKKVVKEVHTGFECAFLVENYSDWQENDRVECFIEQPDI